MVERNEKELATCDTEHKSATFSTMLLKIATEVVQEIKTFVNYDSTFCPSRFISRFVVILSQVLRSRFTIHMESMCRRIVSKQQRPMNRISRAL